MQCGILHFSLKMLKNQHKATWQLHAWKNLCYKSAVYNLQGYNSTSGQLTGATPVIPGMFPNILQFPGQVMCWTMNLIR
ncbi:hypothetical protein NE237_005603 [Protea cynaroides]|uniref:Uncharacterized protein n=1 Tax=Protea cynaroides TaxID=273540 RepID=A0A9Q0GMA2_9MAGN|nr:hypothetical protein NE237_005603 [Protea cynaroides]